MWAKSIMKLLKSNAPRVSLFWIGFILPEPLTKRWMRFVKREASSIERKALKGLR